MSVANSASMMMFAILCLFAAVLEFPVQAQDPYDLVFVANLDPPGIFIAPADTFNFTLIPDFDNHPDISRPVAIDYDPIDAMVYWTDVQHSTISRAFLDGTGLLVLLKDLRNPDGLSLDLVNRVMYWTDTGSDLIERATLDGLDRSVVLNLTNASIAIVEPRPIVLDTVNSHLFWADWGSSPKIERANTDGTSRMILVDTELQLPNGLALDITGGRMYWCDAGLDRIESTNLLGQDRQLLSDLSVYNIHPFDIWVYLGSVYWTDWRYTKLLSRNQLGEVTLIGSASFGRGGGLHIYDDTFTDHSCVNLMPCGQGERCRQFQTHYECVCKDGSAGVHCLLPNPCSVTSCSNGGTCFQSTITNGSFFCQCPERYSGTSCEIFDNPCNSSPCLNGGTCVVSLLSLICICSSDFIGANCEAESHPYDLVFVSNLEPPGIFIAPADTFNFTLIPGFDNHSDISRPVAIDYDPVDAMVYWTDVSLSTISRAFLDGTGLEVLLTDLQTPDGLSLDLVNRVMYWTDTGSDLIERATLDGLDRSVVLNLTNATAGAVEPRAIHVDPINGYMYWTDWGSNPKIERSGTDGSSRRVLIDTNLQWPNGLSLDLPGGKLYWCDAYLDRIESSDLLGNGRTILVDLSSLGIHPFDIAFYYDYIYWTDWAFSSIIRVDAMATAASNHGSHSFDKAGGLHIYKDTMTNHGCNDLMPCLNGGRCRQHPSSYECVCVDGFTGVHCQDDNQPPVINGCPDDITIPVKSASNQAPHSWLPPVISDNSGSPLINFSCLATVSWECNPAGSGLFAVGVTTVTYDAEDNSGNRNDCSFAVTVTVVDIVCPAEFTVFAEPGFNRTRVDWSEPDLTGWQGSTNFTSTPQPGVSFLVGFHTVTYQQWFGMYNVVLECSFSFEVVGQCMSSSSNDGVALLSWPVTIAGSTAKSVERCPLTTLNAGEPYAVRNCSIVEPPVYFQWEVHELRSCGEENKDITLEEVEEVEVSRGNAAEVAGFLANRTSGSLRNEEAFELVSNILVNIANAGSGDTEVTELVVETVNNVITNAESNPATPGTDRGSSSAIIQSVETQVALTLQQEGHVSIQQNSIHVEAVSLDLMEASNGFSFVSLPQQSLNNPGRGPPQEGSLNGTEVKTFMNTSEIPEDVVASIRLPANIVDLLLSANGNSSAPLRASFIIYSNDTLFQSVRIRASQGDNSSRLQVAGSVVSLTVEDVELVNLTEPVVIEFRAPTINASAANRTTIQCVFWDFELNDKVGDWSGEGCKLARETDATISCNCNHATNFAILVDVKGQQIDNDTPLAHALDIISQVGGVLSIIALAITLIVYLSIKKLRTGKSRQIFIHFCISLLLLYIVFLAGVDNATGSGGGCVFVAALLHYLTLTTMMWMAVEARNMYVSTVKVFPEDASRYMLKASVIAWGIPLVAVVITLAAATDHYNNDHYCFLQPGLVLYIGLLVPIGLILIHNIITFILVMRSLLKVQEVSRSQQITKRLLNAVGISALLGLTWSFGFLAISGATFAFQLLFCLANSFQGVFIFVMFCALPKEVRTAVAPYMKHIYCCRDLRLPKLRNDLHLLSDTVASSPSSVNTAQSDLSQSAI